MKNFYVPLPDEVRKARRDAIAAYALEMAGTSTDLDEELESSGIEYPVKAGKA